MNEQNKASQKANAKELRNIKNTIKSQMRNGEHSWKAQNNLIVKKYEFRHKHIAYCISNGTEYEKIENKVKHGNKPNWNLIHTILKDEYNIIGNYEV